MAAGFSAYRGRWHQSRHFPGCGLGRSRRNLRQGSCHIQGSCGCLRLRPLRRNGRIPRCSAYSQSARQPYLGVDESSPRANTGPGEGTGGSRARPAAIVQLHALDVRAPRRCQCRNGPLGAQLLPAHRLSLCARQARPCPAPLLCAAAGCSHHRNRHQLHCGSQHG